MKNILIFLSFILGMLATEALSQEIPKPEDATAYYFVVFTHSDWQNRPDEARLMSNISQEPVKKLVEACHFKHYTSSDKIYVSGRYWNIEEKDFPVLVIANPRGRYFYKVSGQSIPSTASGIFSQANIAFDRDKELHRQYQELGPPKRLGLLQTPLETSSDSSLMPQAPMPIPTATPNINPEMRTDPVFPNAFWNNRDEQAIEGIFGGDTPVRDTVAWAGWIVVGLVILGILCVAMFIAAPFGIAALWLFMRLFKKD